MAIEFRCTQCSKLLRTADDTAGKKAKCPECGAVLDVPASGAPVGSGPFGTPGQPSDSPSHFQPPSRPVAPGPSPGQPGPSPFSEEVILAKVRPPAIALLVTAILSLFLVLADVIAVVMAEALPGAIQAPPGFEAALRPEFIIPRSIFAAILYVVMLIGALKMMRLENYGLSMAAAIIGMLPCGCCCIIGLPFGIWSLVVLSGVDVRAAFRS